MNNNLKGGLGAAIAIVALISIVAVASPDDSGTVEGTAVASAATTSDPTYIPYTPKYTAPTSKWNAPKATDPYSTNGTWLVPSQIKPGNYLATPDGTRSGGYIEVCADIGCDIDFDGSDYTGMISNDYIEGQGYVTIPESAFSITLDDLELSPVQ